MRAFFGEVRGPGGHGPGLIERSENSFTPGGAAFSRPLHPGLPVFRPAPVAGPPPPRVDSRPRSALITRAAAPLVADRGRVAIALDDRSFVLTRRLNSGRRAFAAVFLQRLFVPLRRVWLAFLCYYLWKLNK